MSDPKEPENNKRKNNDESDNPVSPPPWLCNGSFHHHNMFYSSISPQFQQLFFPRPIRSPLPFDLPSPSSQLLPRTITSSNSTNPLHLPSPSSQLLPWMIASSSTNPQDVPAAAPPPAPANPSSSRSVRPRQAPSNRAPRQAPSNRAPRQAPSNGPPRQAPSHGPPRQAPSNEPPGPAPSNEPREGKSKTIPPPFQWATDKRAIFLSIDDLLTKQIFTITGEVHCMSCKRNSEIGFDLKEKFSQVWNFIAHNKSTMHDRAPRDWMSPKFPNCGHCGEQVRPVIANKKRSINWLFLFLGQMVSYCTLEQLKYFCKHTVKHRTGAKDRLVYTAYLELCRQLVPDGPFHP